MVFAPRWCNDLFQCWFMLLGCVMVSVPRWCNGLCFSVV